MDTLGRGISPVSAMEYGYGYTGAGQLRTTEYAQTCQTPWPSSILADAVRLAWVMVIFSCANGMLLGYHRSSKPKYEYFSAYTERQTLWVAKHKATEQYLVVSALPNVYEVALRDERIFIKTALRQGQGFESGFLSKLIRSPAGAMSSMPQYNSSIHASMGNKGIRLLS